MPAKLVYCPTCQKEDWVVTSGDVILLIRRPKYAELALAGKAEQVDKVKRALAVGLSAILDVVGNLEELSQP